jgi:hypothetical protein
MRYDYTYLQKFSEENTITLLENYSEIPVNIFSYIKGKCLNTDCENEFNKSFRSLIKTNGYCLQCSTITGKIKSKQTCIEKYGVDNPKKSEIVQMKTKLTNLKKYGVEFCSQSKEIKDKIKENNLNKYGVTCTLYSDKVRSKVKETWLNKYGTEWPSSSEIVKNKRKNTCKEKYGVEFPSQLEEKKQKAKETCIKNFGVEYPTQSPIVMNKMCINNLEKYGVEHTLQNKEFREKAKKTCLQRYGKESYSQTDEYKNRIKQTCLDKYGVEYASQSNEFKEKAKQTCLQKYGVTNVMYSEELMEKYHKNSYKIKEYIFPSGRVEKIQGYEEFALLELVKNNNILESDIILGHKNVPKIWYTDENGKQHRHYVDIFIASLNKCIEVKSTWTIKKKQDNVFLKQNAAKDLGYKYEIWVYNSKGEKVEFYE